MSLNDFRRIVAAGVSFAGIVLVVFLSIGPITNVHASMFRRYSIDGEVVSTSSLGAVSWLGTDPKIGVSLRTENRGDIIVVCKSTECSALIVGQQVILSCSSVAYWYRPAGMECYYDHLAW